MSDFNEDINKTSDCTYQPKINDVAQNFIADLIAERKRLGDEFPLINLLIDDAIDRIYTTGRIPGKEFYADVFKQKPMKITQKVFVPVKQYPKFNFTGKILGPKGNSLRRLQEETQCRITIKGRSSIRDRAKEEELRNSGDARYAHLNKDLFLEIATVSTPAEAYARIAYALAEVRKYLVPDKNDDVSYEQLRELMEIDPKAVKLAAASGASHSTKAVFDKKINKIMEYIKHDQSYGEEEDEEPEHDRRMSKESYGHHPQSFGNKREGGMAPEYGKPRVMASSSPFAKRGASTAGFTRDTKRLRVDAGQTGGESSPRRGYPYSILKKYK